MKDAVNETAKGNIIMIIGHLNAKVGNGSYETVCGKFGLGERNENHSCKQNYAEDSAKQPTKTP